MRGENRMHRLLTCLLCVVLMGVLSGSAFGAEPMVIAPVSQAPAAGQCVYVDQNDAGKLAAGTALANWLSKATGTSISVAAKPADRSAPGFYVGYGTPSGAAVGYVIDIQDGKRVIIDGADVPSLRMGVYDFLQNDLGFNFWSFDDADLPSSKSPTLKAGKREVKPGFGQVFLWNREADNMPGDFRFATRSAAGPKFTGTHNLYALIGDYAQSHPSVYPMDSRGERGPNNLHLCYSARGLPEAIADALSEAAERRRGNVKDWVYFVGPGNVQGTEGGMCECNECQRVYKEEAWSDSDGRKYLGHSATLLKMMNQVAGILGKKYPGIKVGVLMQMSQDSPTGGANATKPAENLIVQVRRVNTDAVHAIDKSARNEAFLRKIQKWCEIAPGRTYVWDPAANFDNLLVSFPNLLAVGDSVSVYQSLGVAGITLEGSHGSPGSDAVVMKNWVLSRKVWNPALKTQDLVKAFCDGYYGPASAKVMEYLAALQATVDSPKVTPVSELEDPMSSYLTPENLAKLDGILEGAVAAAGQDANYARRVAQLRASVQAARFWQAGPLEEHEGKLVRTDFEFDIAPQVDQMISNLRGGAARESANAQWYYQVLKSQSGGPAVTLTSDPISAVVAPVQGSVWRVLYADLPIMENATLMPAGTGEFTEKKTDSATFTGPVGVTRQNSTLGWTGTTQVAFKGDTLSIVTNLKQTGGDGLPALMTRTQYPVASGDRIILEVLDGGQYVPVMFKPGQSGVSLGKFEAIKIRYMKAARTIVDRYPDVKGPVTGELSHDKETGALTVTVKLPEVVTVPGKDVRVCRREVVFGKATR
jgi:hypothetical protein